MLTHKGTQTLHTNNTKLTLRRFTVDDAEAMFENWANDERVTRFLTWTPHKSPEFTRQLLEAWCAEYENLNKYNWAMIYNKVPVGNISVVRLSEKNEYAELGYCMGFSYWNKGLMTEAARTVIDYLFSEINMNRIGISHAVKNPASGKVALKCGLTFEGTKREYHKTLTGEFLDISEYSILRREWKGV